MSDIIIGNENDMTSVPSWDTECFNNFVDELASEVTGSCMIPMNLPKAEVQRIVKRAKKWFYKNYEYSMKENFVVLPVELFSSEYFKTKRSFTLPGMDAATGGGEVYSVYGCFETGSKYAGSDSNFSQGDFAIDRMLYTGMFSGDGVVDAAENLQYYVVNESFFDLARQILENPIGYHYNQLTHEIKFTGETPNKNIILEVYETIPECALFEDEAFFRYCAAKIKISLGQKLSIFGFALPGNVEVNADAIQGLGEGELEAVIEEIKNDEGTDWMMHS